MLDSRFSHLSEDWKLCIDRFVQHIESITGSVASRISYTSMLALFFATDRTKSPEDFTRQDIRTWLPTPSAIARNHRDTLAAATVNHRLTVLVSFWRWCSGYELPSGAPIFTKKSPTDGIAYLHPARPRRVMSQQELKRFFLAIPRDTVRGLRDYALMLVYLVTCRRANEIARLKFGDLEFTTIADQNGARREGVVFHYCAKNRARDRLTQELPLEVWRHVDAYLVASGRKENISADDPLFAPIKMARAGRDHTANRTLNRCYINLLFKEIVRRAGLDESRWSLHSLRHTGCTERFAAGVDLRTLQRLLGHSSIATTDRYIAHLTGVSDESSRLLFDRLGEL